MPRFLVERFLSGNPEAKLSVVADLASAAAAAMREEGTPIWYLGSTLVPEDELCYCLFEGPSAEAVAETNRRAGLTYERILEALWVQEPINPATPR